MIITQRRHLPLYADFAGLTAGDIDGQSQWAFNSGATITGTVTADGTVPAGKYLSHGATAGSAGIINWSRPGSSFHDQTVLMLVEPTAATGFSGGSVAAIGSGTSTTFSGITIALNCNTAASKDLFSMFSWSSGTATYRDFTSFSWALSTKYWMKLNISGDTFQGKAWAYGAAEPGAYQLSWTNSTFGAMSGLTGLGIGESSPYVHTQKIYWFSVGLGSDAAPTPEWAF